MFARQPPTPAVIETLMRKHAAQGSMCSSCAWGKPAHPRASEFCENGAESILRGLTRDRCESAFSPRTRWPDCSTGWARLGAGLRSLDGNLVRTVPERAAMEQALRQSGPQSVAIKDSFSRIRGSIGTRQPASRSTAPAWRARDGMRAMCGGSATPAAKYGAERLALR